MSIVNNGRTAFVRSFGNAAVLFVFSALILFAKVPSARAESLFEALVSAYVGNPSLNAARAGVRATDEEVPRALSGLRPTIIPVFETGFQRTNSTPDLFSDGKTYPKSYSVSLTQPLFRGFRTINSIREAEANVRAARHDLKTTEQSTLLNAVTAYMNVVRDIAIVRLRQNNVDVLSEQLRATEDRHQVGEVTMTDLAQARARRAGAVSQFSFAQANLKSSQASYFRVIGNPPGRLHQPGSLLHTLPETLRIALEVGLDDNPEIIAAKYRAKASRHAVDRTRGELLPEVEVEANYAKNYEPSIFTNNAEVVSVVGRVTVPLYQGGEVYARIRQSKQTYAQRRDELTSASDKVRTDIITAWSELIAARAQLASDQTQVNANRTALEGVKEEERVGQRTVLDVLDAEQELLNSQVSLVGTQRDLVVASFSVLSAIGRLTANDLGLPVEYYDPEDYYNKVRRKWIGSGPGLPSEDDELVAWQPDE